MERVELPGGAWADLRPMDEVKEKDRRVFMRAWRDVLRHEKAGAIDTADGDGTPNVDGERLEELERLGAIANDLLTLARVAEWSYGLAVTLDGLSELSRPAYVALRDAATVGVVDLIRDFQPSEDKSSPTGP